MATLTGNTVASTYRDLLQVSNSNSGIDATLRTVEDGEGTNSVLKLSTTAVSINGLTYPTTDGTAEQVIETDGSGNLSFATIVAPSAALGDLTDVTITSAGSGDYIRYSGSAWVDVAASQLETDINHDNLTGFVANEHIDWTAASATLSTTASVAAIQGMSSRDYTAIGSSGFPGYVALKEDQDNGTEIVGLIAPPDITSSYNYRFPVATASSIGQTLYASDTATTVTMLWGGHDDLSGFVANEHIDWTSTASNFSTSGTLAAGVATITGSAAITNSGATAGFITLEEPNGDSTVKLTAPALAANYTLTFPVDDGTAEQVMETDGSGNLSWVANSGSGLSNIVEDLSPQLGAQLDVNTFGLGDGTLELLTFTETGSAVNHINVTNAATGTGPIVSAIGDDANIDLLLRGKATGNVYVADGTDSTKDLNFELSGATTAKTMTVTSSHTDDRTLTLPDVTDTLVGKATTDTLTNKSIDLANNTVTSTKAQLDTAVSDGNVAYDGGAHHDGFSDFVANEHLDWTNETNNFYTTGVVVAGAENESTITIGGSSFDANFHSHADTATDFDYLAHRHSATSTAAAAYVLARSRGTGGSETVVVTGDRLGELAVVGHDGTDYAFGARIQFNSTGTIGANTIPTNIVFKVAPDGGGGAATAMTILESGNIDIAASKDLSFNTTAILSDSAGTMTLSNIDAIDATTETTLEAAIDTLSNLTTTGALDAGSITSNFGTINNGASSITTTGALSTGAATISSSLDITNNGATAGFITLEEPNGDSTIKLTSPALAANYTLTFPTTDGSAEEVMETDGSGNLSWVANAGGGAPEGTAVLSTGEVGGTKFLREDGDGTCSWQAPAGSGDMVLADVQVVTGKKTFGSAGAVGKLAVAGTTSGSTIIDATAVAGATTLTLPAATDTLVGKATTDTLTNKTLTSPTLTTPVLGTPSSGVLTNCTGTAAGLTAGAVSTITGLAPDTATTAAAQTNITSLGTLTALQVDNININGNTITSSGAAALNINQTAGQTIILDGAVTFDAGVVTGATSVTSTTFVGALTGNADTVTTNANLTGDVTSSGNATTIAAKAVDVAMLADGTDGELITWSATGVAATVAVGTSGHVLTSNGVGAAPTFQAGGGGGPSQATQAAIEAETNEDTYAPPDLIKHSPGVAKQWVDFNGTGTAAINTSYNTTSLTDNGSGDYTITVATDFSTSTFALAGSVSDATTSSARWQMLIPTAAGTYDVFVESGAGANTDAEYVHACAFGDQA